MHDKNTCSSTCIHIDYWRMTDTFMQFIFLSIAYRPINHPLLSQHIHLYNSKTKAGHWCRVRFFWQFLPLAFDLGKLRMQPALRGASMELEAKKTLVVHVMIRHDMKKQIQVGIVEIMFIRFHNHPSEYILFTIQAPLKCPHCPPLHYKHL